MTLPFMIKPISVNEQSTRRQSPHPGKCFFEEATFPTQLPKSPDGPSPTKRYKTSIDASPDPTAECPVSELSGSTRQPEAPHSAPGESRLENLPTAMFQHICGYLLSPAPPAQQNNQAIGRLACTSKTLHSCLRQPYSGQKQLLAHAKGLSQYPARHAAVVAQINATVKTIAPVKIPPSNAIGAGAFTTPDEWNEFYMSRFTRTV